MEHPTNLDELAAAYFAHYRLLTRSHDRYAAASDEYLWAWDTVEKLVTHDAEQAWLLVLRLVAAAPDENALAYVTAGPIENFLRLHAEAFAPAIISEAGRNPALRTALTGAITPEGPAGDAIRAASLSPRAAKRRAR